MSSCKSPDRYPFLIEFNIRIYFSSIFFVDCIRQFYYFKKMAHTNIINMKGKMYGD